MKTAGVMFDFYDDPTGSVLKSVFPDAEKLPEVVKTAHILNSEERDVLRDDAYALVMHNEGQVLRKFACVDPGNTLLSLVYFEKTAGILPKDARDAAYASIIARAEEFGLLEKEAVKKEDEDEAPKKDEPRGSGKHPQRKRDSMSQPFAGDDADWAERTNLRSIQAGGPSSGRVGEALANLNTKTASVDVSGAQEVRFVKQAATHHALGHRFPLDSYADIRAAVDYFKQSWPDFQPPERHEFAVKVASRAEAIGLEVPELMARYGSTAYAPDVEAHLANRKANCEKQYHEVYDALKEKRAEIEPEHFAALLAKVDTTTGLNWHWGGAVSDPWLATFGGTTQSEKTAFGWEGGGYTVDAEKLQEAAASGALKGNFTDDVVAAFEKDPVTIFSSMPDDTKLIMARLASE
jgi:hypothetical protein